MADLKKLAEQRAALLTQASALVTETAERGESLTGEAQERERIQPAAVLR